MKKTISRILALLLAAIMLLGTVACTKNKPTTPPDNTNGNPTTPGGDDPGENQNPDDPDREFDMVYEENLKDFTVAPRPTFTDDEIASQMEAGKAILEQIRAAAADLSVSTFTIPAGNYGFTYKDYSYGGVNSAIMLDGLDRPDDKPLTIEAEGAVFYVTTLGKPCAHVVRNIHIKDSSNLIIRNLTLDSYEADDIEGKVTRIDRENNRIAIKLSAGTMELDSATIDLAVAGSEARIVPCKANGDYIVPTYSVDGGWGPGSTQIKGLASTGTEGEYWITLKTNTLLNTIYTDNWLATYGKEGTIEEGDGIVLIFGTQLMSLDNCKKITIEGFTDYVTKGGFWENGGYGAHVWKDCYFGPHPGTSQILGAEGNMCQGTRHGTTFDNVTVAFTTDDALNIHGFWSEITQISGKNVYFNYAPVGIQKGDKAELLDENGKVVQTLTVAADPIAEYNYNGFLTTPITFEGNIRPDAKNYRVRWPASECDGWTIKNCTFENIYQRILINSGSGTFENNKVKNMGGALAMVSNSYSYEGGVIGDITVRDNVFLNSTTHPSGTLIDISQTTNFAPNIKAGKIIIMNNIFVSCGKMLKAENVSELTFFNNTIVSPIIWGVSDITRFNDILDRVGADKQTIKKNTLIGVAYPEDSAGGNTLAPISKELFGKLFEFCDHNQKSAKEIIEVCNKKVSEALAK